MTPWTFWGGNAALSFETWVKLPTSATEKYVGWRNSQLDFRVGATSIAFGLNTSSYTVYRENTTVSANTWHHLAWVYDGSNMRIYLDGALIGTPAAKTGTITTGSGALQLAGVSSAGSFTGTLDEVAAYTTALSAARISAHWQARGNAPACSCWC